MNLKSKLTSALCLSATSALLAFSADAHISIASGPGTANATQEVAFGVGHGCEGADTYAVTVDIPAGVTGVRALPGDFGKVSVQKDAASVVTSVTWQKADADLLPSDDNYYKLVLRLRTPNQPFTQLYFPTHQTCKAADGTITKVDWVARPGEAGEAAPALLLVEPRTSGWNKYVLKADIADLSVFFASAQIVWKGNSAYSSNPNTVAQIAATPGVTPLSGALSANDEIWVKY